MAKTTSKIGLTLSVVAGIGLLAGLLFLARASRGTQELKDGVAMGSEKWSSGVTKYQGLPLGLRRPVVCDYDQLQPRFPRLIVMTHHLAKVRADGMPEEEYNLGLADLDHEIITHFAKGDRGKTVLVELFAGRRNYYIYTALEGEIEAEIAKIKAQYPDAKLTSRIESDPTWKFIRGYAKEFWPRESTIQFPDDDNGHVLRNMANDGVDLSKSYDIDFGHLFADESGAKAMAEAAANMGHKAEVHPMDEKKGWDCTVVVHMKPTYEGITTTEESLGRLAIQHSGKSDGWGMLHD